MLEHDFCQAEKAENTDPRTNYAVKYAAARGHLISLFVWMGLYGILNVCTHSDDKGDWFLTDRHIAGIAGQHQLKLSTCNPAADINKAITAVSHTLWASLQ